MKQLPIFNRDAAEANDGWHQIEVTGEHPAGKKRKQIIDDVAMQAIINRFQAEKQAAGENFAGLLVDADHLSHDMDKRTEAFGWLQDLCIRDGQLHGKMDLTDIGEEAIKNRRYKFLSTEYDPQDLEDLGNGKVRPLRLSGLAFTNRPNNRGAKPISNRSGTDPGGESNTNTTTMQPFAKLLGLPDDADEAAITAKITELLGKLTKLEEAEAATGADAVMNRFKGRIPKDAEKSWRERLIKNRAETEALMDLTFPATATRIFNRDGAKPPEPVEGEQNSGDDEQAERISKQEAAIAAIRNRNSHTSYGEARRLARAANPQLFS